MTTPNIPAIPAPPGPVLLAEPDVPQRAGALSVMSTVSRDGEWVLPRLFRAVAFLGQVDLDLTRVRIGAGVSEIEVVSIMGQVNIIVPHNLRVECEGDPVIGEFKLKYTAVCAASADAPLVRVKGIAFMGGVKVKVVDPNAPNWFDRWRAKKAAKA